MREELAALMHEIWGNWTNYIFQQCRTARGNDLLIPEQFVKRWSRQMGTPYDELSEEEKDSGRREADKVLRLLAEKLLVVDTVIERNPSQSMPERIAEARYAMTEEVMSAVPVEVVNKWLTYIEDGDWLFGIEKEEPGFHIVDLPETEL